MNNRQIDFRNSVGKRIKAIVGNWQNVLIAFDDGTFSHLACKDDGIRNKTYIVGDSDVAHSDVVEAGVFTRDEIDTACTKRDAEFKAQREKEERATYEQLKRKFE